ncbi:acyltransferase family protein [Glaciecola sp. 1036]|uniref:acyltransferase family protein n=1 Tax=Alteromonadaceae TaxID=72275 RepID=UPI003D041D8D
MIHREISDKKYQMDSLDGLRGLAALIVVMSHTSNAGMFYLPFLDLRGTGKSGVFLFFLLSSFLLTLPLLKKGKQIFTFANMSHYWQRRFFRIYPLYTIYLLLAVFSTIAIGMFLGREDAGVPFSLDWFGFLKHLALMEGKGVTWSIAVEFKFYFTLPFFVFAIVLVRPYGAPALIAMFLLLMVLSQLISPQDESLRNDARLLPYMPIFIIGMFLAVLQDYINNSSNKHISTVCRYLGYVGLIGVVCMTPLVFSLFGERVENNYFHKQFILYAIFWSLVLLSSVNYDGMLKKFFTMPILRFFGALSFSLYLFHPIFINTLRKTELNGYLSAWLVLLGATCAAYISFKLFEGPISKFKLEKRLFERKTSSSNS